MKGANRRRLKEAAKKVDGVISKIKVRPITDVSDLLQCGAVLVTEMLGVKSKLGKKRRDPWSKRRFDEHVRQLKKELGSINTLVEKLKKKHQDALQQKFKLKQKRIQIVKEGIQQRTKAK